jgi:hypothetical protein
MNHLIFNILIFLYLPIFTYGINLNLSSFQPDSIPPPPPGQSLSLTGPSSACTGDTSVYFSEVPLACICQWAVNGTVQPDTGSTFSITWNEPGSYIVTLLFVCAGGQTTEPNAILTEVISTPDVHLGNDTTLAIGYTLILDAGNPGSDYLWSTGATSQTILVSVTGIYSVIVSNSCGTDQDTIDVTILVGNAEIEPDEPYKITLSNRVLSVTGHTGDIENIDLFDLTGKIIYSGSFTNEIILPRPGIFLLKLTTPGKVITRKFFSL